MEAGVLRLYRKHETLCYLPKRSNDWQKPVFRCSEFLSFSDSCIKAEFKWNLLKANCLMFEVVLSLVPYRKIMSSLPLSFYQSSLTNIAREALQKNSISLTAYLS